MKKLIIGFLLSMSLGCSLKAVHEEENPTMSDPITEENNRTEENRRKEEKKDRRHPVIKLVGDTVGHVRDTISQIFSPKGSSSGKGNDGSSSDEAAVYEEHVLSKGQKDNFELTPIPTDRPSFLHRLFKWNSKISINSRFIDQLDSQALKKYYGAYLRAMGREEFDLSSLSEVKMRRLLKEHYNTAINQGVDFLKTKQQAVEGEIEPLLLKKGKGTGGMTFPEKCTLALEEGVIVLKRENGKVVGYKILENKVSSSEPQSESFEEWQQKNRENNPFMNN